MATNARPATAGCQTLLAATFLSTALAAQHLTAQQASHTPDAGKGTEPAVDGLPTFLLKVPGGTVSMGLTVDEQVQLVRESINPNRPELADREANKFTVGLKQTASELGQEQRTIETYLLGKWPVTNREYEAFLLHMKALGTKIRPPFHWWRYGRKDDYDQRLEEINQLFPKDGKMGPVYYWERFGPELPYALNDDRGNSIADHPVVYIDRMDALRYAGWVGMRLPTEEERTRAVRGDAAWVWPWGGDKDLGDKFSEQVLERMQLSKAIDKRTKPVGSVPFLTGPFGHFDVFGQVWELTTERSFAPICGQKAFDVEWRKVQKHRLGSLLASTPQWKDGGVIVKGASYLAWSDPIQFHVDCRVSITTDDVLEAVGFRLAKSLKPGYDLLHSLITSDYSKERFLPDQDVDMAAQIGVERYVLDATGFPSEYHAVSFAPVTWLSAEKTLAVQKFDDRCKEAPVLVGTLACTEPMLEPKLPSGIYSVLFRRGGVPKELKDAWSAGHKEVQRAIKQKERGGEEEAAEPPKEGKADKKGDWRTVLARYGLGEKDLESKDAKEPTFVRFDALEVPIEDHAFLFHDNENKIVGWCKSSGVAAANLTPSEVAMIEKKVDKLERLAVEFKIRGALLKDQKKGAEYKLDLVLDQPPPAAGVTWRLPLAK